MYIKTRKSTREDLLQYFYIEIPFSQLTTDYHFKLPMIAHVRGEKEVLLLRTNIIEQMIKEGLMIGDMKLQSLRRNEIEAMEEEIKTSFANTEFTTIELALKEVDESQFPPRENFERHQFKINTVTSGAAPFKGISNLFVFTIPKSILED